MKIMIMNYFKVKKMLMIELFGVVLGDLMKKFFVLDQEIKLFLFGKKII